MKDSDRKDHVAAAARAFSQRRIGKRDFLRRLARGGVGLSGFAMAMLGGPRPFVSKGFAQQAPAASPELMKWLEDVGRPFKGTKIRFVSEPTPPTLVARTLARDEFTARTGIEVEIAVAAVA